MSQQPQVPLSIKPKSTREPVRPSDLIYWLDDNPPLARRLMLAFQHVAVICPYLVFLTLIMREAHASVPVATSAVSLAMLGIALMTVLQAQRFGWIGSGFLAPPVVSAIYFAPAVSAAHRGGIAAVFGMIVLAGLAEALFAWILPYARKIFSPVVSGLIVMAVAAELGLIGIRAFLGITAEHQIAAAAANISTPTVATACLTLMVMLIFGVWGRGLARLLCGLVGLVVGVLIAIPLGLFVHKDLLEMATTPLLALPDPRILSYRLVPDLVIPFVIAALASGLRTIGVITTVERINDASWTRPDLANVRAGVMADGIGCALGGLLAAPGLSTSPSLVGLEKGHRRDQPQHCVCDRGLVRGALVFTQDWRAPAGASTAGDRRGAGVQCFFDVRRRRSDNHLAAGDDAHHLHCRNLVHVRAQPRGLSGIFRGAALMGASIYRLHSDHRSDLRRGSQHAVSYRRAPGRECSGPSGG